MKTKTVFKKIFTKNFPLKLESGKYLKNITVAYQTFGKLNEDKTNAILINHALTGNAHVAGVVTEEELQNSKTIPQLYRYNKMYFGKQGWWSPLIGKGKAIDTEKYFVVCPNVLGSCYGTTGPASKDNSTKKLYRMNFPEVTVRDMVRVQKVLMDKLGIKKIKMAIGGSLGGMQVLEWASMYGNFVESIMPIATSAAHSPWAIGLNEASRNAIINDPKWNKGNYKKQPETGLKLARKIAMLTYRSYDSLNEKFGRKINSTQKRKNYYEVESYLDYQGEKLTGRFDANTYLYLSKAMDLHDIGKGKGGVKKVLKNINCKTNCVGINSDILYPVKEQKEIASCIPNATYSEIDSPHGHDAFLIEFNQLEKIIRDFLKSI